MNTIDRVCDWLANHELVGLALLVGTIACGLWALGRLLATRIPDGAHDEHETSGHSA
jgi:hypothetical protein